MLKVRSLAMKIVEKSEKDHDTAKKMLLYLLKSQIQSWYVMKLSPQEIAEELETLLSDEDRNWIDFKNETFEKESEMSKVKYTEGRFVDMIEEVGQELDSSHNEMEHEVGQMLMLLRMMMGGAPLVEAMKSSLEYEEKWQKGVEPYTPKKGE